MTASTTPPAPATPGAAPNPAALLGPAFLADPYPVYAALRRAQPVFRVPVPVPTGAGVFLLTRYAEVQQVLRSDEFTVDRRRADAVRLNADRFPLQLIGEEGGFRSMLVMDPPDHTRVRGLVNKAFTPRRVQELAPRIEALAADLLEEGTRRGRLDVMEALARPLPAVVIAELLGVPVEDHPRFRAWAADMVSGAGGLVSGSGSGALQRGVAALSAYFRELIALRRREPRDDLMSALVAAQQDRDALSDAELLATCVLLLVAGHETTTNLIGNGLLALLRHPDQMARLRDDPALLKPAVEEMLRFDGPVQATVRVATRPMTLGGVEVGEGALVVCGIGAANRDPETFAEPDRFDVGRRDNHHLAFGFGAHFCLGAPLARLEAQVAFRALFERFPRLVLDAEDVEHRPNPVLRGLVSLPVRRD